MFKRKSIAALLLVLVVTELAYLTPAVSADSAENQGLEISKELKQRGIGWEDSAADVLMILKNKHGDTVTREIEIKALEQQDDGDKSLTIFNKPRDVKGTAFLSFSHVVGSDDQWLFLPALKRVKRIASRNKSGPFMSSEFAFEDLSSFELGKYTYKYLGDDEVNGLDSFKVEQLPVDKYSGYAKRIAWIDKDEYRFQKVDFYDRRDKLLKTLSYVDYKQYLGKFWRPDSMSMLNHQNGKSTILEWSNFEFKTGLNKSDFNHNSLKRSR